MGGVTLGMYALEYQIQVTPHRDVRRVMLMQRSAAQNAECD